MTPLLAYLDPGTGSLILQVLLGVIAASWVFLRTQWDRIRGLFRRGAEPEPEAEEAEVEAEPEGTEVEESSAAPQAERDAG